MSVSRQNKAVIMNSLENSLCSLMKVKQLFSLVQKNKLKNVLKKRLKDAVCTMLTTDG